MQLFKIYNYLNKKLFKIKLFRRPVVDQVRLTPVSCFPPQLLCPAVPFPHVTTVIQSAVSCSQKNPLL